MVEAIIALIAGIVALVPLILNARKNRKDNQNAMGKVDDDTLRDSMRDVDKLFPDPPKS